jgi:hypothetical protein
MFATAISKERTAIAKEHEENLRRIREYFSEALGRDLTPEEQKYLGLSAAAVPNDEIVEVQKNKRKSTRVKKKLAALLVLLPARE